LPNWSIRAERDARAMPLARATDRARLRLSLRRAAAGGTIKQVFNGLGKIRFLIGRFR